MIAVRHLLPAFMTHHGPSGGVLAQLQERDPASMDVAVWSMYPPPADRDPTAALERIGVPHEVLGMGRSFFDLRVLRPLLARLRTEGPDILHCHLVRPNLYGRLAGTMAGVPVVISTLRNVEDYFLEDDATSRMVRAFERGTMRLVDHYVAVSEGVRRAAIERLRVPPGKITTVLNAVDLAPFRSPAVDRDRVRRALGLGERSIVLGTAGLLEPRKDHATLLHIVAALRDRGHEVEVVIAGEGSARKALETLVDQLGLGGAVRMPGFQRDIPAFLGAIDVFVMTSRSEGLPRAVMEAMASGLPCVVSDAGGTAEAVVEGVTGHVHAAGDVAAFVASLERLLADSALRETMGDAARREAFSRFSPSRMAEEYTSLYDRLLSRGRRRVSE
ncbi:MAG TPA: glycosyltransferase [Gemmatimonadales bacterium]